MKVSVEGRVRSSPRYASGRNYFVQVKRGHPFSTGTSKQQLSFSKLLKEFEGQIVIISVENYSGILEEAEKQAKELRRRLTHEL